jgi:hypothetical protein
MTVYGCAARSPLTGCQATSRPRDWFSRYSKGRILFDSPCKCTTITVQVEHKVFPVHFVNDCGRVEVYVHVFVTYTTDGGECSASRRGCFTPTEKDAGTLNTGLGGLQSSRSGRFGEEKNHMKVGRSSTPRPSDCRDAALLVSRKGETSNQSSHVQLRFVFISLVLVTQLIN